MWHLAILPNLDLYHYTWPKWFETLTKLSLTLHELKTRTFGQRKGKENKNIKMPICAYGHFYKSLN
jgi:hypothetical protein